MRDSAGRMVIDHGSNLGGGRYSLTTSTLVAGKVSVATINLRGEDEHKRGSFACGTT
jgi:hypothetical protein